MDVNLRKLGSTQLYKRVMNLASTPEVLAHSTLVQARDGLAARRLGGEAYLSLRPELLDLGDACVTTINTPVGKPVELSKEWRQLRDAVANFTLEYPSVTLPFQHNAAVAPDSFLSGNGVEFKLGQLGAGYLSERMRDVPYSTWTRAWREGRFADIAGLTVQHAGALAGRPLVAAIVDGKLQGLMSSYNNVPHAVVLDLLETQGLTANLRSWDLTETGLQVDLKVADVGKNLIAVVRIQNGHSGHFSLNFTAALVSDGYDWEAKGDLRRGRRRHLSHVQDLVDQLKTAVDDVATVLFDQNLRQISYAECLTLIGAKLAKLNVRQEQVMHAAQDAGVTNALELVEVVAPYGQTKGWGSAVCSVLDPLVQHAVELSNGSLASSTT